MITSKHPTMTALQRPVTPQRQVFSQPSPLFSGKKPASDSFARTAPTFAGHTPKKHLALYGLLAAAGLATPALAESHHKAGKRDLQISDADAINIINHTPYGTKNPDLLFPALYGGTSKPIPATQIPDENQVKGELKDGFKAQFNNDASKVDQAMALMDDSQLKALAPDFTLRAALVSLSGTSFNPAIQAAKDGIFSAIKWVDPADFPVQGPHTVAEVVTPAGATKPEIWFSNEFNKESFSTLAPYMGHETLFHQDLNRSGREEQNAYFFEALNAIEQAAKNASHVQNNTPLQVKQNSWSEMLLNSGKLGTLVLNADKKPSLLPGSADNTIPGNFSDNFSENGQAPDSTGLVTVGPTSPGNKYVDQVVKYYTGQEGPFNFDEKLDALLNKGVVALSPQVIVSAMNALQMDIPAGTVAATPTSTFSPSSFSTSLSPSSTSTKSSSSSPTPSAPVKISAGEKRLNILGRQV